MQKEKVIRLLTLQSFFSSRFRFAAMDSETGLGGMPWAVDLSDFPNPNANPMISYLRTRMIWCWPEASRAHLTDTRKLNDTDSSNQMDFIACSHFSIDSGSHLFILIAQFFLFSGRKSNTHAIRYPIYYLARIGTTMCSTKSDIVWWKAAAEEILKNHALTVLVCRVLNSFIDFQQRQISF